MTLTEPVVVQRDQNVPGPWQVLAGGDRTAGSVMFGEARVPGHTSGPGLHVHTREDEAVFVISGVITFVVGDRTYRAGSGELVWLPREVPHTFANLDDEPAWAFGTTTPAGLEAMFAEQAEYFASLQGPPDPAKIGQIGARYGVRALGPPLCCAVNRHAAGRAFGERRNVRRNSRPQIPYCSCTAATIAMRAIRRKKTARGLKSPTGAYLCATCNRWHLTRSHRRRRRSGRSPDGCVDRVDLVRLAACRSWKLSRTCRVACASD